MGDAGFQLEPQWDTSDGCKVSFLCETIVRNPDTQVTLVKSVIHRRFIKLVGVLPEAFAYSVLDGMWDKQTGTVNIDPSTFVIPHRVATIDTFTGVTELCAGIGAMTFGMEAAGCRVHVKNDIRSAFTDFLNNDGFLNTVCGDITMDETIFRIYEKHPQSTILTAGFSCQPWSRLGDSKKLGDSRSSTLTSALRAGFLLRSSAIILECVAESGRDPDVRSIIRSFCKQTGFWVVDQELHLEHLWPSRRHRWWCLLVNPTVPRFDLRQFPKLPFAPTVGHVLPVFPEWPEPEVQQLLVDQYEYGCFEKYTGIPKVAIDLNKPLPTALHGWGNQLMGCPCGCRLSPLSLTRLQEKGLWGAVLPLPWSFQVQGSEVQACRHIHPWELAILTGARANRTWMPNLKLSLCGLGQMATPFHSAWITAQLVYHTSKCFDLPQCRTPEQVLWDVASCAFEHRDSTLPALKQHAQVIGFVDCIHNLLIGHHQSRFVPAVVQTSVVEARDDASRLLAHEDDQMGALNDSPPKGQSIQISREEGFVHGVFEESPPSSDPQVVDDGYLDPHWDCPYDDCIICILNGSKPPVEESSTVAPTQVSHDVMSSDVAVSPTLHFTVHDDQTAEPVSEEPPTFSSCGGHPAFAAGKRSLVSTEAAPGAPIEGPEFKKVRTDEHISRPTSEMISEISSGSHVDKWNNSGAILDRSSSRIVVVHRDDHLSPQLVRCQTKAPIRSLISAEMAIQQSGESFCARDIMGQPLGQSDIPSAFQHVFLSTDGPWCPQPCHDNCQPPKWFEAGESCSRIQMLYRQESWTAKDEMDYYLQIFSVAGVASGVPSLVFDDIPSQFDDWVLDCAAVSHLSKPVVSAVLLDQHWIPFAFFTGEGGSLKVFTSSEGLELCQYCQFKDPCEAIPMPHLFEADCGFQTVGWLIHVILDPTVRGSTHDLGSSFSPVSVPAAAGWRRLFEHHLFVTGRASDRVIPSRIKIGGAKGDSIEAKLQDLLHLHAVPSSLCADRSATILDKIGRSAIAKALRAQRPWAELKSLANSLSPKLQLVLPSELESAIQNKASEGKQVGDKSRKKKQQPFPLPLQLQPQDITVPDGVFKHGQDIPVPQIPLSSIGKASQGVVIVNALQAKPYLSVQKPISQGGLALLVLDHADPHCQGTGQIVQFPARFQQTGEPLIARARLIQLGESEVSRHIPTDPVCVEEVKTHVIRALVFRDEMGSGWEDFVLHPVKYLLENTPALVGGSGQDSNILDVWDRQFVSLKLEKLPPRQADLFIVSLRVTTIDLLGLLSKSGQFATYFEPRDDSGRHPSEEYRVVWLPKNDKGSVVTSIQVTEHWACLARSGIKLGIRTQSEHAKGLHEHFRPAVPFLEASELSTFTVGPMPYGATRASLVKVFGQWGWKARPCQPRGRSSDGNGVLWECQASAPPPFEIYTMKHAAVFVSQVERKRPQEKPPQDILASAKTLAVLKQQSQLKPPPSPTAVGVDPLMIHDPWTTYVPTTKVARVGSSGDSSGSTAGPGLDVVNRVVEQKIEAKFAELSQKQQGMEDVEMAPHVDTRMSEMEHRLSSLEAVVQTNHQQQQHQQSQVVSQISHLQQQVDSQGSALQRHLDEKLSEQLSHIERILGRGEKKPRGE